MAIPLAADVKLTGIDMAQVKLNVFNESFRTFTVHQKNARVNTEMTTASLLKLWGTLLLVASASAIAGAYASDFRDAIGAFLDQALEPLAPVLDLVLDGLWAFTDWFFGLPRLVQAALSPIIAFGVVTGFVINFIKTRGEGVRASIVNSLSGIYDWLGLLLGRIRDVASNIPGLSLAVQGIKLVTGEGSAGGSTSSISNVTNMPVNIFGGADAKGIALAFHTAAQLRRLVG